MQRVWEESKQDGSALLLLLAIADCAHEDGSGAWPSVACLAQKTRQSERNTQFLLRRLEASGDLVTERGAGPHGCNAYRVIFRGEKIAPLKDSAPEVKNSVENIRQISPEPSLTVNEPSMGAQPAPAAESEKPDARAEHKAGVAAALAGFDERAQRGEAAREAAEREFEAMPSASEGVASRPHNDAGIADPRAERKQLVARIAPMLAEDLHWQIVTDGIKRVAGKIYDKKLLAAYAGWRRDKPDRAAELLKGPDAGPDLVCSLVEQWAASRGKAERIAAEQEERERAIRAAAMMR